MRGYSLYGFDEVRELAERVHVRRVHVQRPAVEGLGFAHVELVVVFGDCCSLVGVTIHIHMYMSVGH